MQTSLEIAVARRLAAIRAEMGLDQPEMADWLGVSRSRYNNWAAGRNLPNEEAMVRLAERTQISLDYIYRGKLDAVPMALAIRLQARELDMNPDAEPGAAALCSAKQPA